MSDDRGVDAIPLGTVAGSVVRLPAGAAELAAIHGRLIALELGSHDAESSLAGYWGFATRIVQWRRIAGRVGLGRLRQARCLEIGSGMGLFTVVGRALGFDVAGVEYASDRYQRSLRVAAALSAANALPTVFIQARSEELPLPDASVDVVASFQTFEHVTDLSQSLR
jgi:2-polyprenyl-3-methyl-5-hydroxy-6-metoxy-1,4-benzoquinol methylase